MSKTPSPPPEPHLTSRRYLYNDSAYLAEQLADFAATWKQREDISTRAQNMLRLDNDIKSLQNFANRAYANELGIQKTVLRDLLGGLFPLLSPLSAPSPNLLPATGEQNLMHTDDTASSLSTATGHVRSLAAAWEAVLARSVWQQAVGALVDAVAAKLIADVMDLPSIGQDEAYSIAKLIASAEELDDLFVVAGDGSGVPRTAQFAASWLRLKYLSEVLQSNLRDVRFLWVEGELSLYFTAEEVVDLVKVSFEDNVRTREVIREIRANVRPRGEGRG